MNGIDVYVLQTLYALRDPAFVQGFIAITQLGSTFVIGGLSLLAGCTLIVRQRISHFIGLCICVMGTIAVVFPLKELIARARPDILYQVYAEDTFSFPSGHAAFSIALYGFITYLAWKYLPEKRRGFVLILATLVIGLVGFSRLYLGLHFASDVLAGYAIGGAFLAMGIVVSERLSRLSIWS